MAQVDGELLGRYRHWKVFGSGTWSTPVPPCRAVQIKTFFAFIRQTSKLVGVPFHRLVWAARIELGEKTQREHLHWLIGNQDWTPSVSQQFQLMGLWDSLPSAGYSRSHIFNPELNAFGYITKALPSSGFHGSVGGDFYESSKFGFDSSEVILSDSFALCVGGRRVRVGRHLKNRQRGQKRKPTSQNVSVSEFTRFSRMHPYAEGVQLGGIRVE